MWKNWKEHKYWEYIAVNWYLVHYLTFYCIMVPWEMVPWDTVICWMFHGRWCHGALLYVECWSFQSSRPVFCEVRFAQFSIFCAVFWRSLFILYLFAIVLLSFWLPPFGLFNISLQHKHVMYRETCVIYS